jgi:uncharacterized protein YpmS
VPEKSKKKYILWSLLLLLLVILVLALTALFAFFHQPPEYQPQPLTAKQKKTAENHILKKSEELYNNLSWRKPFLITFEQQHLNQLLLLAEEKKLLGQLTSRFQHPQIYIDDNRINIRARFQHENLNTVVTLPLQLTTVNENTLRVQLKTIKAGAFPIPESVIKQQVLTALESWQNTPAPKSRNLRRKEEDLFTEKLRSRCLPRIKTLIRDNQVQLDPVFTIEDDQTVRIKKINLTPGTIEMTVEPLTDKN